MIQLVECRRVVAEGRANFGLCLLHDVGMLTEQIERPTEEGGAGVVSGNEHGEQLVTDEVVIHSGIADEQTKQISRFAKIGTAQANHLVEIVVHLAQTVGITGAGQMAGKHPNAG